MQSFHLTSYITSPLFLAELENKHLPYDVLLSDFPYTNSPIPLYTVANKPGEQSLLSYWSETLSKAKHPLLVLEQFPLSSLFPLLEQFSHMTIINLYAGIGSFGRKLTPELEDLTIFPNDIAKYEPIDAVNFFTILEQPNAKYLRIPHQHFPESIFSTEEIGIIDAQMLQSLEVFSLQGYGFSGGAGTLLATGANFATTLQLGELLNEQSIPMDIFILSKLTIDLTEEIKSSLHKTKKLYVLIDHLPSEALQKTLYHTLEHSRLHDIAIHFLTPNYAKLTTMFDEFSIEQAEFDAEGLITKVNQ
jgi:hypothetical protein